MVYTTLSLGEKGNDMAAPEVPNYLLEFTDTEHLDAFIKALRHNRKRSLHGGGVYFCKVGTDAFTLTVSIHLPYRPRERKQRKP